MVLMMVAAILGAALLELVWKSTFPTGALVSLGVLLAGVASSFQRNMSGVNLRLTPSNRVFLREFGLAIFMCGVGVTAGHQIANSYRTMENFWTEGMKLVAHSLVVVLLLTFAAFYWIKRTTGDPLLALCAISCFFTSSLAIDAVKNAVQSENAQYANVPEAIYAMAYPFALSLIIACSVLLSFAG
jgi:uncharacterized transporter YbjL